MAKRTKARKGELQAGIGAVLRRNSPTTPPAQEVEKIQELSNTVAMIPVDKIIPNPKQPRKDFDKAALKELSESLMVHGLIQPITVRRTEDGSYEIISGERRWQASQLANLKEIPAYVRVATDKELMEMALVENIQREDLNPVEMANALWMLKKEFDLTIDEVAKRIGKKRPTVSGYLSILRLSDTIKESIDDGSISMGHAKALVGLEDATSRSKFYTKTIENNWSVRALEDAIRQEKERLGIKKDKTPKSNLPTEYQSVLDELRARFGSRKISLRVKADGKGQIVLPFSDTAELNRFLDTIEGE